MVVDTTTKYHLSTPEECDLFCSSTSPLYLLPYLHSSPVKRCFVNIERGRKHCLDAAVVAAAIAEALPAA